MPWSYPWFPNGNKKEVSSLHTPAQCCDSDVNTSIFYFTEEKLMNKESKISKHCDMPDIRQKKSLNYQSNPSSYYKNLKITNGTNTHPS